MEIAIVLWRMKMKPSRKEMIEQIVNTELGGMDMDHLIMLAEDQLWDSYSNMTDFDVEQVFDEMFENDLERVVDENYEDHKEKDKL